MYAPASGPTHGILTTFGGGAVVALLVGGLVLALPPRLQRFGSPLRLATTVAPAPVFAGAFLGVASHVVLDAMLDADVQPFWPLDANPFLGVLGVGPATVYALCVLAGLLGLGAFVAAARRRATRR